MEVQEELQKLTAFMDKYNIPISDSIRKDIDELKGRIKYYEGKSILFAVDDDNVILSKKILLLNGFLKKSTKDYSKQIKIAKQILEDFEL